MQRTRLGLLVLLAGTLSLPAGCGDTSAPAASSGGSGATTAPSSTTVPSDPRERWRAAAVTHYRFDYLPTYFGPGAGHTTRIEVKDGRVVGNVALDPGDGPGVALPEPPTVDSLLAMLERAEREATGDVRATYDPVTGVPTLAAIDWLRNGIDDEYAWKITNFVAL